MCSLPSVGRTFAKKDKLSRKEQTHSKKNTVESDALEGIYTHPVLLLPFPFLLGARVVSDKRGIYLPHLLETTSGHPQKGNQNTLLAGSNALVLGSVLNLVSPGCSMGLSRMGIGPPMRH